MSLIILNVDEVRRTLSASAGAFVVHDKEVDIVRFAINSGFADIVLDGQVALRVMYQRPGESQVRAQTLTYYDTDGLRNYYDWQLLSADLAEKGTLTVALCILRTDSTVEEWHTTPCQISVLNTIHTDDSDEGDETITPTVAQRVAVLETMIQRVASGAPVVVSSVSAMTDMEQIYVLSTDGEWYYHNGTAWVAGGEYGAVATDVTLTQPGKPADAKAVGDEITDLKDDLNDIRELSEINLLNPDTIKYGCSIDDETGAEVTPSEIYNSSDFIELSTNVVTIRSFEYSETANYRIYAYDSEKTFINKRLDRIGFHPDGWSPVLPSSTRYIRIVFESEDNPVATQNERKCSVIEGETSIESFVPYYTAIDVKARSGIEEIKGRNIIKSATSISETTNYGLTYHSDGEHIYINGTSTGSFFINIAGATNRIPFGLEKGKKYRVVYNEKKLYCRVLSYDSEGNSNNIFDSLISGEFIMPNDCVGIIIRFFYYSNTSFNNEVIEYPIILLDPSINSLNDRLKNVEIYVNEPPSSMLTIIDDDGHTDYKTYLLPFCHELKVPISTAVTTLRFGSNKGSVGRYMTLEEIKECMTKGAEVLCHTYSHTPNNQDIRKIGVINGSYNSASSQFIDEYGVIQTGSEDYVYHDTNENKYYIFDNGFSTISQNAAANLDDLIAVYTDVSGYLNTDGTPAYDNKEDYFVDKLTHYYGIAKRVLQSNGFADSNIVVFNNATGYEDISKRAADRLFRCGFNVAQNELNFYGRIDSRCVNRYGIEYAGMNYYDLSRMKQTIDQCVRNKSWMVWTIHTSGNEWRGISYNDRTGIGREEVLRRLKEAVMYARKKKLPIVTASYACQEYLHK